MKFKFIGEHVELYTNETTSTVTIDLNADTLGEVLRTFEDFLRGCGYVIDGSLDIINEEEYNDSSDGVEHSDHYFDFDRNKPIVSGSMDDNMSFSFGNFGAAQPTLVVTDDDYSSINISLTDVYNNESRN